MIYDEWSQLQEVIVGASYQDCPINGLDRIVEETNEDLDELESILASCDVVVHRPIKPKFSLDVHHPIMPRDIIGFYGDQILQTYGAIESRGPEHLSYSEIGKVHMWQGYVLTHMWKPTFNNETYEIIEDVTNKVKLQQKWDVDQIMWETANFLKCGDAILHTQTYEQDPDNAKGTARGLAWCKSILKDYKWIEIPAGGHADGKLALLRPGLLMTWREDFIPEELKNWDKIIVTDNAEYPEEFKKTRKERWYEDYVQKYLSEWVGYSKETWFDVNCLSINENTIITTGKDKENICTLEKYGFDVIQWDYRHRYFWDGGAHCVTQDTHRKGKKECWI